MATVKEVYDFIDAMFPDNQNVEFVETHGFVTDPKFLKDYGINDDSTVKFEILNTIDRYGMEVETEVTIFAEGNSIINLYNDANSEFIGNWMNR